MVQLSWSHLMPDCFLRMSTKKIYPAFIILAFTLFVSCSKQESGEQDFVRMERWLEYYGLSLNDFSDTLNIKNNPFLTTDSDPSSPHFRLYRDLFVYSPDKQYAVDIDSYFLVLEKNNGDSLVCYGTNADQEIALINLKEHERQRILFCGTACRAEEVQWTGNNNVLIMGFSQPRQTWVPVIWIVDLEKESLQEIKTNNVPVNKKPNSYNQSVRLNHMVFR